MILDTNGQRMMASVKTSRGSTWLMPLSRFNSGQVAGIHRLAMQTDPTVDFTLNAFPDRMIYHLPVGSMSWSPNRLAAISGGFDTAVPAC
jgi:hypothetical protein